MFWIQNPDAETESRIWISSPVDVTAFNNNYKLIRQIIIRYGKFKEIHVPVPESASRILL